MTKPLTNSRGSTAIEFALILPILVLLLFGMVEFSLLLYNKQVITNASREGARYGIVAKSPRYTEDDVKAVVRAYWTDNLITFGTAGDPVTNCKPKTWDGLDFGDNLEVTITYDYDFLVLANYGFGPVTLTAKTVMKLE